MRVTATAAAIGPAFAVQKTNEQAVAPPISPEQDALLEEVERGCVQFFIDQSDPDTGLVKDRARADGHDSSVVASIASTGFGLTAFCIGEKRGYLQLSDAHARVLRVLRFLHDKMPTHRGFFYHFANIKTGERIWESEVSSIDTALLLCGLLTARAHFAHPEIDRLAREIFNRVEWEWLSEDTSLLPQGWSPETGFLPYRWDLYSELMMIYLLGLGSVPHSIGVPAWNAWKRTKFEYDGIRYIGAFAPLFVHQYSQAWFDFRDRRDQFADYFLNSIRATEAHRLFCIELKSRFPDYGPNLWGITASDSERGYVVWGGPPEMGQIDGTVAPSAAGGSLPFLPQATLSVLQNIRAHYPKAWSRYGFVNAFNPLKDWYDVDVVGIDTGITMVMAENLRTGFVWDTFMKNPEPRRGLERAGFSTYHADYTAEQAHLEARVTPA